MDNELGNQKTSLKNQEFLGEESEKNSHLERSKKSPIQEDSCSNRKEPGSMCHCQTLPTEAGCRKEIGKIIKRRMFEGAGNAQYFDYGGGYRPTQVIKLFKT